MLATDLSFVDADVEKSFSEVRMKLDFTPGMAHRARLKRGLTCNHLLPIISGCLATIRLALYAKYV